MEPQQSPHLPELLRGIASDEPSERTLTADQVTDLLRSYTASDVAALAGALTACAVGEEDLTALEAQLHALLQLSTTGHLRQHHLWRLEELHSRELPADLREYLHDLLEE